MNPEEDFLAMKKRFNELDLKIKEIIDEHHQLYNKFKQDNIKMPAVKNANNRNHNIESKINI